MILRNIRLARNSSRISRSTSNDSFTTVGLGLIGGSLFIAYRIQQDKKPVSTIETFRAAFRIYNLCSTVFSICSDYGYIIYISKSEPSTEYDDLVSKLKKAQSDERLYSLQLIDHPENCNVDRDELKRLASNAYVEVKLLGAELAKLSENAKTSRLSEVHKRSAIRLRNLCAENRGVYIKLGQHLAQLDYLLPLEYISVLRTLLATSPESGYDAVKTIITEDFGEDPEKIWKTFVKTPIASASLAQVHIAWDHAGNKFAVKVQHKGLRESSEGDMYAITLVINIVARLFPQFSYTWLSREMNRNLPLELDFENEAKNLSRCTLLLGDMIRSGDVAVPTVHRVSPRVLVMSYEEGAHVSDTSYMEREGLRRDDVARLVSTIFCQQIFRHGFVHCDPHEANLLVRRRPGPRSRGPQIVLLDHGLYRALDEPFRRSYCRLWAAILAGDVARIRRYCEDMGTGTDVEAYSLLSAALVMRPWEQIVSKDITKERRSTSPLAQLRTLAAASDDQSEVIRAYAQTYLVKMMSMLGSLPSSLLLLLKTNDCLRHIDRTLGAPINTAAVVASVTADVIFREDLEDAPSLTGKAQVWLGYSLAKIRAAGLRLVSQLWWIQDLMDVVMMYLKLG